MKEIYVRDIHEMSIFEQREADISEAVQLLQEISRRQFEILAENDHLNAQKRSIKKLLLEKYPELHDYFAKP